MINPITEMKADVTTAKVLQSELHHTLKQKRQAVHDFYEKREQAELQIKPTPSNPPRIEPPPQPKFTVMADKEKEAQLLQMAKARYQSYADVATFAKELGVRAGIVYLTLKHHGFIRQNESTQYRVLDSYYKNNGNLKAITEETGLTVWICAKTLEQLGLSPNWQSYRMVSELSKIGAAINAEAEFLKLVPQAVDMNREYSMNHPGFDFVFNEKTVDVKCCGLSVNRGTSKDGNYGFKIHHNRMPDFYCAFLLIDKSKGIVSGNYRILLIPSVIIPQNKASVFISHSPDADKASAMYWDFEVEPAALGTILETL